MDKVKKILREVATAQKHRKLARFTNLNSMLGNDWAMFYVLVGGRMTGKSYSVTDYLCKRKKRLKANCKNYWMRISDLSTKAMLSNNADKLVDPDLKRKYKLNLKTKGMEVYNNGAQFMTVTPLSSFGKLKGVGFYDKDYKGEYNLVLDEFQLEQGERRTSFDILYNFIGMCENIARTTKSHIRVFLLGNTLEEASTILKAFNFIPEKFGRFYLRSKKCIIDNIEPTEEYLKDREGSIASILGGDDMSNYTNTLTKDVAQVDKTRVKKPTAVIKFTKQRSNWYMLWDGKIIKPYRNQIAPYTICMRPYIDGEFNKEKKNAIIEMYDSQALKFDCLITKAYFEGELQKIRKNA